MIIGVGGDCDGNSDGEADGDGDGSDVGGSCDGYVDVSFGVYVDFDGDWAVEG